MALSSELISELVKATNAQKTATTYDNTVYGTVVKDDTDSYLVQIDGSDGLTPITSTVELNEDDRVVVTIKNHTATVMGNTTSPSIGVMSANGFTSKIEQTAEKITAMVQGFDSEATSEMTADQIKSTVGNTIGDFTEFKQTVEGWTFTDEEGTVKISSGSIELTGSITWADLTGDVQTTIENATPHYQYSINGLTAWHDGMTSSDKYRRESYDGGVTWGDAYQFRGTDGANGSDASVTFANILSALQTANSTKKTFITAEEFGTVNVYANNIYGGNIYAGVDDDMFARITDEGFLLYHSNNAKPKIKLGLNSSEVDAGIDSNYASVHLVLGSGTNDEDENAGRLYLIKNDSMGGIYYYDPYNNRCGISFLPSGEMEFHGTVSGLTPTFG